LSQTALEGQAYALVRNGIDAFTPGNYDVAECRAFIATPDGGDCLRTGCRARLACPIGQDHIYEASQAEFHMQSFLKSK